MSGSDRPGRGPVRVLGVNAAYHESAACLIEDGRLVAAVEEERFSRVKHAKASRVDNADELPWRSISFCLAQAGIGPADVDHVGWSFDPDARLRLALAAPPPAGAADGDWGTPAGERAFHAANLRARAALQERFARAQFYFVPHHLAHAASAFLVSPYEDAAVLVADGIAEHHSTWLGLGCGTRLETLGEVPYPHSLGFLWEKVSVLLGFDVYAGPGKVMGYAGLTDPLGEESGADYHARFRDVVRLLPDGTFAVDPDVARFRTDDFRGLERLFGARRRRPVDRFEDASVAAGLQAVTEDVFVHLATHLHRRVNAGRAPGDTVDRLCLAGGVALNCVANDAILRRTPFRELWVQPAANDAGTAVGAAAWIWNVALGEARRPRMDHAFWGPAFGPDALRAALDAAGLSFEAPDDPIAAVVDVLADAGVVAWFDGALELGPRALGHRSILADATRFDTRNRLNAKVKQRESFRPFAPSLLPEEVPRHFAAEDAPGPAEYMLRAVPCRDVVAAQQLPAVVQTNLSTNASNSRIHVVRAAANPRYHDLLTAWKRASGRGVLLNTSFNISEPIVCTPEQAIATFARSGMDLLALGPFLVRRAAVGRAPAAPAPEGARR
jgi:carbamoyltransferase